MSIFFSRPRFSIAAAALAMAAMLSGCGSLDRLSQIGKPPPMTPIQSKAVQPRPVSLPMPKPDVVVHQANSLWQAGARAFFKDQRASRVGDILTVYIDMSDQAKLANTTKRSRQSGEDSNITNFLGLEAELGKVMPKAFDPTAAAKLGSTSTSTGAGSVDRKEEIKLTVAAIVTQILPNGNLVIRGRQEVRVNFEKRELLIAGVVRPQDISATNTIRHDQIAEARIAYGGHGQITDVQQPRYGQQLFDVLFPF
jgi:flagellar L-ring protein precursor FlgH